MKDSRLFSAGIILVTSVFLSVGIGILNYLAGNSSIIAYILCSIPVIISLFHLGASIHLTAIDNRLNKEILEEVGEIITERMSFIGMLISRGKNALKSFNVKASSELTSHNEVVHLNISMLRRLVNALEERQNKLVELSRNTNLKEAEELSFAPLVFVNSSLHSVDRTEIPNLEQDQWEDSLNALIGYLVEEKVAA